MCCNQLLFVEMTMTKIHPFSSFFSQYSLGKSIPNNKNRNKAVLLLFGMLLSFHASKVLEKYLNREYKI